ncbi:MAG: nickel pincer cofactor biosynthesis protein LarB [Alphaproteobacteria bacterium]|uniref:Nickel pincer cofactor biosynthesis protein LarB n=1 Tax=Candidatus Nitrobium versatile TaxID=2884831 RepID=A0A953JAX7_9BACT|nr:nickel pincer cofactor biosynthesis protein LarB [Candidatus Nitrobium versatile]
MRNDCLRDLMTQVAAGEVDVDSALQRLKTLPYEDIDFAKIDHHRSLRQGIPEIIYGAGKTTEQIIRIIDVLDKGGTDAIVTRTDKKVFASVRKRYKEAFFNEQARMIILERGKRKKSNNSGFILVISAGTSDIPVAEEAAIMAEIMGNKVERLYDVGVAGIHRLFDKVNLLMSATVLIVVAGMEGALPSVVGGLVDKPVIAVPTSVGYGANFHGLSALLGMLNSCSPGVAVVNIDNGFGAGCIASLINRARQPENPKKTTR